MPAYLLAKVHAAHGRGMTKDWYDVAYVLLHNDDGGPEVAARRVVVRFGDMLVGSTETALTELSTNFTDADSQGSVAYATTMSGMHTGEWPGGVAPPGSRRTRREGLPSPGSHRPTWGARDQMPMGEELGLMLSDSIEPCPGPLGSATQSLEFLHGPSDQVLVDAPCDEMQLGAVEGPVVADPASDLGVDVPGDAGKVLVTAPVEVPGPDLLADRLGRFGAHGRVEAYEQASFAEHRATPEGVAEEVEADMLRVPSACRAFAVHDLRLVGMQLEAEGPEPAGDNSPKVSGLFLGVTVGDNIISVAFERAARVFPVHPTIESIMHEEVGQQWGDRRPLWGAFLPGDERPVRHLHGGFQPPFDVQQNPAQIGVVSYRFKQ